MEGAVSNAFELKPLLVAMALGAALVWVYAQTVGQTCGTSATSGLLEGAAIGAGVQIGVRLMGVS
jgi:hypothetical protein